MTGAPQKTARTIRKNRIIVIGGVRMKVLDPPVTKEDPELGTLFVFRCEVLVDRSERVVRRSPGAKIEVER